MNTIRSVCVYCGLFSGNDKAYIEAGGQRSVALWPSPTCVSSMAAASKGIRVRYEGSMRAGGKVLGIIPRSHEQQGKQPKPTGPAGRGRHHRDNMHQRKQRMSEESDAFVAPAVGGIGTVEEIVEMMTWAQLGYHRKPMVCQHRRLLEPDDRAVRPYAR